MSKRSDSMQEVLIENNNSRSQMDEHLAKNAEILLMFVTAIIAVLLKFFAVDQLNKLYSFKDCDDNGRCIGNQAVYRLSFAAFMWFFGMAILTMSKSATASRIHNSYWVIKVMMYLLFIVSTFFIPNEFFTVYADIARFGSFIFLILQIYFLIDFAYDLQEYLNQGDQNGDMEQKDIAIYLCIAVPLLIASIAGCVLFYVEYPSCVENKWFISILLCVGIIITFLSLLEQINVGLIPPAVVFAYGVLLTWQAIYSNPDPSCNPHAKVNHESVFMIIFNLLLAILSITWASASAASQAAKEAESSGDSFSNTSSSSKFWVFHIVLCMASMYLAMALTNWGSMNGTNKTSRESVGIQSMWVKIAAEWFTFILFIWTLLAPICFPDRDFTDRHNRFLD